MNPLEHQITYPMGDTLPAPGVAMDVAPGVRWIRMGLPFALDHINLWLLRDRQRVGNTLVDGWTVVDCCIDNPLTRAQWEDVFASSLDGLPVLRVIVTHMHPDHIGLAHWLCARWNARLWISATDYYAARAAISSRDGFSGEAGTDFYTSHGARDEAFLSHVHGRGSYYHSLVPDLPTTYRRMMDGDAIEIGGRTWNCISGYGHAPEHIALHCPGLSVLISGDMVLPRISTNVSVHAAEPEADPLRLFLSSIARYLDLPADTLTLPSHGKPFTGMHVRIGQLQSHHQDRLQEILEASRTGPLSATDVLPVMFKRPLDPHQMTFALGEALAHLHLLWLDGRFDRVMDAKGVYRFGPAGSLAAADQQETASAAVA